MKSLKIFCACMLFAQAFFITITYSQITINSSDHQNKLNVLIKITQYFSSDTSGLTSVLSASGENKTWNLTGRSFTVSDTTTSMLMDKSSSGAPLQSNSAFSSATMVVKARTASKPLFTTWSYESLSATGLFSYGSVQDSVGIVKSSQSQVPAWRSQTYPTTHLTSWSWSSAVTSTSYSSSSNVSVTVNMTGSGIVDGYGSVITPEGTFQCLRIKSLYNILFGFFKITTCSYQFVDQNRTYASINADETGLIPGSVRYYRQSQATDISVTPLTIPPEIQLWQNYPNPFNPSTTISYSIPIASRVTLKVYDLLGREIETLVNEEKPTGSYEVKWKASRLSSGVYYYRLQAGSFIETKKMMLLK